MAKRSSIKNKVDVNGNLINERDNDATFEFEYMKTPLYKFTFKNKRIKRWVERNCTGLTLNLFAGCVKLNINEVRNDLNERMLAEYHMDALSFILFYKRLLRKQPDKYRLFDTVLLDPPYSYRKSMEKYEGVVSSPFNKLKEHIPFILNKNGWVITFGYHSVCMGSNRGFTQEGLLLMSHGGAIHDTIAVKERRLLLA